MEGAPVNKGVVVLGFLIVIMGVLFIIVTSRVDYVENPEWRRWYFYEYGFDLDRDGFNDVTGEPWYVGPEPPRLIEGPREYPNLGWGLVVVFVGFVTVLVGLLMKSVEDVKRELRVCRICGRKISKWQAESLGLCQKCFEKTELAEKGD